MTKRNDTLADAADRLHLALLRLYVIAVRRPLMPIIRLTIDALANLRPWLFLVAVSLAVGVCVAVSVVGSVF